jgi:TPR repeat protein
MTRASTPSAAAGTFEDGETAFALGDYATALRLWLPLAEQGDFRAQYNIGIMYSRGEGVLESNTEAEVWVRKAAEQGHAKAQYDLGFLYKVGLHDQDYVQSAAWYRMAAEQGHVGAQFDLGVAYEHGSGVPQDYVLAHMWFNLSAARKTDQKERADAVNARDRVAAVMTREQIADAQRLAREWKPKPAR